MGHTWLGAANHPAPCLHLKGTLGGGEDEQVHSWVNRWIIQVEHLQNPMLPSLCHNLTPNSLNSARPVPSLEGWQHIHPSLSLALFPHHPILIASLPVPLKQMVPLGMVPLGHLFNPGLGVSYDQGRDDQTVPGDWLQIPQLNNMLLLFYFSPLFCLKCLRGNICGL